VHPDVDELRPKLKEILYDCAVEIHATKAALFLLNTSTRKYDMVTEYGFRSAIRHSAGSNDPMVDRCSRGRAPFYVNNPGAEPRLSELLFAASTERLMGVPLFSRGQLVGFLDIRDKAQKQPFDQQDVTKAQSIADRILRIFANKNIWNQRFITLSDAGPVPIPRGVVPPAPAAAAVSAPPKPVVPREEPKILTEARNAAARILAPSPPEKIGSAEMAAVNDALRSILLLPGAVTAIFTATNNGTQEVASRGTMTQDAVTAMQVKLQGWLSKRGESATALQTTLTTPVGLTMPPITVSQLEKVFTAPINSSRFRGLYLTVAFSEPPDRTMHELLSSVLTQLEGAIESSVARTALQTTRLRIAERLLEPDFTSFQDLRRHCEKVAEITEAFSNFLALTAAEAETVKITALVHDAGMRLLDYDRLYRKRELTHDELALLREHVVVGAALVEPLLGIDVARAVLCHHERIDGAGYPHQLRGDAIPLPSRIVQICDTYVAISDRETYQTPGTPEGALAAIRRGAGGQFDPELAIRFEEMMRTAAKLPGR
jgi:hypothetical protein